MGFLTCYHLINGVKGAPVTQPGPGADRGNLERDKIGRLERFLSYDLHYDAAFVRLLPARDVLHTQLLSNVTVKTPSAITINEAVSKTGRTTALTTGKVSAEGFFPIIFPGHGRKLIKGFQITTLNNARTSMPEIQAPCGMIVKHRRARV